MSTKEIILEDFIANEEKHKAKQIALNAENITKITERIKTVSGKEKSRLEDLLKNHQAYTSNLEAMDPVALATEKFSKIKPKKEDKIKSFEKTSTL